MKITKTDFDRLIDNDLSEYAEMHFRHAGIYVETTAVSTADDADTVYLTRVCKLEIADITTLAQHQPIDVSALEEIEHHADTNDGVHWLYAALQIRFMTAVSV